LLAKIGGLIPTALADHPIWILAYGLFDTGLVLKRTTPFRADVANFSKALPSSKVLVYLF